MQHEREFDVLVEALRLVFFDPDVKYVEGNKRCLKIVKNLQKLFIEVKGA